MPVANPNILRDIHLFEMLDDEELKTLAHELDEVYFLAGQNIFSMGEAGDRMFIVESGRVQLFLQDKANDRVELGFVHAGDLFGELSLLSGEPRSASAKAVENTKLIGVDQNDLNILVTAHPAAALDMMSALSKRLHDSNRLVRERVIRNPNDEVPISLSLGERLSDWLTAIAGDIRFVYFSVAWFFLWISINVGLIPIIKPFDPYPFGFLTMVVSLEAIFLSLFVLISQNRQASREKVRNDIEYDVNLRAGEEIREIMKRMDDFQQLTLTNFADLNERLDSQKSNV